MISLVAEPLELTIEVAQERDAADWLAMRRVLWPGAPSHQHQEEMRDLWQRSEFAAFVARNGARAPLGFAEVYIRPFANGCVGRPVPFLEGVWVAPEARGQGVGRALLGAVEAWAVRRGFDEIGSDAHIDDERAHAAHAAWGFAETERVVYFRKPLAPGPL